MRRSLPPKKIEAFCDPPRPMPRQKVPDIGLPDASALDLDALYSPDYFSPGSYTVAALDLPPAVGSVRTPGTQLRLRKWIRSEMRRLGLAETLCGRVLLIAATAISDGKETAIELLNGDPDIPESQRSAIKQLIGSMSPKV